MSHRDAMIETLNFAFPTVITSGTILAVAGTLIGQMTSETAIVGIGQWPCPRQRRRQRQPARHLRTHRGRRAAGKSQIGGGLP